MIYTILSAKYVNADNTAAIIETKEAAAVLVSEMDTPDLWAALHTQREIVIGVYESPPPSRTLTTLAFMERLPKEERIAIRQAAQTDANLADWLDLLRAAQEVDLDDPRTVEGVEAMVIAGLLTRAEADALRA